MPNFELRLLERGTSSSQTVDDRMHHSFSGFMAQPTEYNKVFALLDLAEHMPDANVYLEVYLAYLQWAKFNKPNTDRFDRYEALFDIYCVAVLVDYTRFFKANKDKINYGTSIQNSLSAPAGEFTHNVQTIRMMGSSPLNEQYILGILYSTKHDTNFYWTCLQVLIEDTKIQLQYGTFRSVHSIAFAGMLAAISLMMFKQLPTQLDGAEHVLTGCFAAATIGVVNHTYPLVEPVFARVALESDYHQSANNIAEMMYRKPEDLRKMPGINSIQPDAIEYPSKHGTLKPLLMNSTFKIATGEIKNFDEYIESFQRESKLPQVRY